jgi:hypothetical protein
VFEWCLTQVNEINSLTLTLKGLLADSLGSLLNYLVGWFEL